MRPPREDTLPWYKQFWPWFLISLPLSVVIASMITINIAFTTSDGLVSDDYYKEGLAIHMDADSTALAKDLGIQAGLSYDAETGAFTVEFGELAPDTVGQLSLKVAHPTRPDQDQLVPLTRLADSRYAGRIDPLSPANWKLEIRSDAPSWRVRGRMAIPQASSASLD